MTIYFIRPIGMDGPVKIGWSCVPHERLSTLMSWSPFKLEIAATVPGQGTLERRFHAAFREHYSHREWFNAAPEITATINQINAGTFDIETLPPPGSVRPPRHHTAESVRAGIMTRKAEKLLRLGVDMPQEVQAAMRTYGLPPEEKAARRLIVAEFVEANEWRLHETAAQAMAA